MKVICPHCAKENTLDQPTDCQHCSKQMLSKKSNGFIGIVVTSAVISATGFNLLKDQRYPLKVEYKIIYDCLNSHNLTISTERYNIQREICICSLERTMEDVSYKKFKESKRDFFTTFKEQVVACNTGDPP